MTATKRITRIGAIFLLVIFLVSSMATMAMAASKTTSRDCSGDCDGETWKYVYVKTGSTANSKKVTLTMKKGTISGKLYGFYDPVSFSRYGAYEIKVCYWNGSKWVQEQDYDVYNRSSKTVTMNRSNTYYRILVYSWRVSTVFKSYMNNNIINDPGLSGETGSHYENIIWTTSPKCTATPKEGCTMYTNNPLT